MPSPPFGSFRLTRQVDRKDELHTPMEGATRSRFPGSGQLLINAGHLLPTLWIWGRGRDTTRLPYRDD